MAAIGHHQSYRTLEAAQGARRFPQCARTAVMLRCANPAAMSHVRTDKFLHTDTNHDVLAGQGKMNFPGERVVKRNLRLRREL